eukprot:Colp12_sorted_trinity150504_noHs@29547
MTFGFADCLQVHENDKASAVIVHMAGLGNFMGNLHPIGSLHDSVVDMGQANKCQNNLIHALEKIGITVHSVKDLLAHGSNDNMRNRLQLEELACESLVYRLDERSDSTLVTPFESNLLSEEYKRKTVESMSTEQLIDIILTKPIITLVKSSIIRPPLTPNPGAQSTNTILMIAPTSFYQNLQTLADNYFMRANQKLTKQEIQHSALQQYAKLQSVLKGAGVQVLLFNHEAFHDTPDAVFPNNWFSTHSAAEQSERTMCLYPMKAPNRRKERRSDIIDTIKKFYTRQVDFVEGHEEEGRFLESTGSLILDRVHRVAYACVSERTHRDLALQWGEKMGYEMVLFTSVDGAGRLIYHTNVVMALGTSLAIICLATIADQQEREYVVGKLSRYHKILEISLAQMMEFCGNVLEVMDGQGRPTLVMSDASFNAFTPEQKETILANFPGGMLHADLSIIEAIGGGGVRCCMGELF